MSQKTMIIVAVCLALAIGGYIYWKKKHAAVAPATPPATPPTPATK